MISPLGLTVPQYLDKLLSLPDSRRFLAAIAGIVLLLFRERIGIDDATATKIIAVIVTWIFGDSMRETKRKT